MKNPAANLHNELIADVIERFSVENMLASLFNDKDDRLEFVNSCTNATDDELDRILNDVLWEKINKQQQMFQSNSFLTLLGIDFDMYASGWMLAVKIKFSEKTKVEEFAKGFFEDFTGDYNACIEKLKSHALKCITESQEPADSKKCHKIRTELTRYLFALEQKFLPYNIEKRWINAIVKDDVNGCRIFLNDYDVDINKKTSRALGNLEIQEDWSPIYIALKKKKENVLRLFLESSKIDHEDVKFYFKKFCLEGKPFLVKIFIDNYKCFKPDFLNSVLNEIIELSEQNDTYLTESMRKVLTQMSYLVPIPDSYESKLSKSPADYLSLSVCKDYKYIESLKRENVKLSPCIFFCQFYKGAEVKVLLDIHELTGSLQKFDQDELDSLIQNNIQNLPDLLNNLIPRVSCADENISTIKISECLIEMFLKFTREIPLFCRVYETLVRKVFEEIGFQNFATIIESIHKRHRKLSDKLILAAVVSTPINITGMPESEYAELSKIINAGFGVAMSDYTDKVCVESVRNAYLLSKPNIEGDSILYEQRWNIIGVWHTIQGLISEDSFAASLRWLLDDFNETSLSRYLSFFPKTKRCFIYNDCPELYHSAFNLTTGQTEHEGSIEKFMNELNSTSVDIVLVCLQSRFALMLNSFLVNHDTDAIRHNLSEFILAYSEHTNLFFLSPLISRHQCREIELYHDAFKRSLGNSYDILRLFEKIGPAGLRYLASEKELAPNPLKLKELFDVLINGGDFSTLDLILKNYEISGAKLYESNPSIISSISNLSSLFYHSPMRCCGYVYAAIKAMISPAVSGLFNMKVNAVLSAVFKKADDESRCCSKVGLCAVERSVAPPDQESGKSHS